MQAVNFKHKKAFVNAEGYVMTVFKDDNEEYKVYIRKRANGPFLEVRNGHPPRKTIKEAEMDLQDTVERAKCKTWYEEEKWWDMRKEETEDE